MNILVSSGSSSKPLDGITKCVGLSIFRWSVLNTATTLLLWSNKFCNNLQTVIILFNYLEAAVQTATIPINVWALSFIYVSIILLIDWSGKHIIVPRLGGILTRYKCIIYLKCCSLKITFWLYNSFDLISYLASKQVQLFRISVTYPQLYTHI